MRELIATVIAQLENGDNATLSSAAPLALYLVERARGLPAFSPFPDWPEGVEDVQLSTEERGELRDALLRIVTTASGKRADAALFVLASDDDPSIVAPIRRRLHALVADAEDPAIDRATRDAAYDACYHAMIVLHNFGEPVFGGATSIGFIDRANNLQRAREYLATSSEQ